MKNNRSGYTKFSNAEILTLYPNIISIEAPISNMIAGIKKIPDMPKDFQPTVPS